MNNLPNIHIYLSKHYIDMFNDLEKYYKFSNRIFINNHLNIIYHHNFDINHFDRYNIIIKMKSNYSKQTLNIMKTNIIFINTFINFTILSYKNIIINNLKLYPYTFYLNKFNKDTILYYITKYNNHFNNNDIDTDFGKDYWIVKDNRGARGINTLIYKTDELISLNKDDIIIQKYLETPLFYIENRKSDIRIHLLIYPKIIKNNKTNKYEIKYNNNKIELSIYIHKLLIVRYTHSDFDLNNKDMTKHLTNFYIQNQIASNNEFYTLDSILYEKIKNKVKDFIRSPDIINKIYKAIDDYPYFYQMIALDLLVTNTKHDVFIIDFNLNPGLNNPNLYKSGFIERCYQKILNMLFKLKYNFKLKSNNDNLLTYLEKI